MIRAGIVGGESDSAGELIRILINHPDVELMWVSAPSEDGVLLSQRHKGLNGETYMRFCGDRNPSDIDVLFMCFTEDGDSERYMSHHDIPDSLKIIDMSPDFRMPEQDDSPWIYALPELNRKPLVRGATRAAIPGPFASAMLLSLLPLAKNLMLNSDIHVSCVSSATTGDEAPGEASVILEHEEIEETKKALRSLQSSFNSDIRLVATAGGWDSGLAANIYLDTPIAEDEIKDLYDTFYEDHGFTFLSESYPDLGEVRGTNKCLLHIGKTGGTVVISSVIDDCLKGGASAAVHVMNLMFGLQERVGLMLKATGR
ncbi:N-acetyl-gamma-glutamyl-phosphate reductase [Muribaculaceae bacterium Isolate-104 (HZI)]|jgi:N-acetyl-gamma-glutamyl-phosphate reductase|nr:N-acetyl-gamma-glutamyl-phosphate reductase [Muribaculaceae bacterium Isolate-104 (HZI)]